MSDPGALPQTWRERRVDPGTTDLAFVQRILRRHIRLMGLVGAVVLSAAGVYTLLQTPTYTAETLLLIEQPSSRVEALDVDELSSSELGRAEFNYLATEYELLGSRSLARQVIEREELDSESFHVRDALDPLVSSLANVREVLMGGSPRPVLEGLTSLEAPRQPEGAPVSPEPEPDTTLSGEGAKAEDEADREPPPTSLAGKIPPEEELFRPGHVDQLAALKVLLYQRQLQIVPVPDTQLVYLRFTSPDSELSARVVNAHASVYIEMGAERYAEATGGAREFLAGTLGELRANMEESERELDEFRHRVNVVSSDDSQNLELQRLRDLSSRWMNSEARRVELKNKIDAIESGDFDALSVVFENPLIVQLRKDVLDAESAYRTAASAYVDGKYIVPLKVRLEEAQAQLRQELGNVGRILRSDYEAQKAEAERLRATLRAQEREALRQKRLGAQYVILEREAHANRRLYESVFDRLQGMDLAARVRRANVFVIDEAQAPLGPSAPRQVRNMSIALLLALGLAAGAATAAELLSTRFRDQEELQMMGVAILGLVPDLRSLGRYDSWVRRRHLGRGVELTPGALAREGPEQLPERTGKLDPRAVAFDAYRTIRTNVMLSQPGEQPRVVLFTSAATGEGKTATVLNTAIMFAHTGARVLVIDADLRNPTCHQVLHHPGEPGLSDTLTGLIEFGQAVQTTESPVDLLPAGRLPPNPAELLGSEVMRKLLDSVRPAYDYVLIDSAPIMSVPDSVLLSTFTDGVVLVVDQKNTSRHQVRNALTRLDFARVRVLGVVLNRLDIRDVLPIHPSY